MTEKKRTLSDLAQLSNTASNDTKTESVVKENKSSMIASIIRATEAKKEASRPASEDSLTASMSSWSHAQQPASASMSSWAFTHQTIAEKMEKNKLAQQLALASRSSEAFNLQSMAEQMEKKMLAHQVNSAHLSSLEDLGRQLKPYPDLANFLSTAIPGYDGLAALEHRLVRGAYVSELIAKKANASSILNENQTHLRNGLNLFDQPKDLLAVSNKIPDHILNPWVPSAADFQRQIDDYKNPLGSALIDYEKQKRDELTAAKEAILRMNGYFANPDLRNHDHSVQPLLLEGRDKLNLNELKQAASNLESQEISIQPAVTADILRNEGKIRRALLKLAEAEERQLLVDQPEVKPAILGLKLFNAMKSKDEKAVKEIIATPGFGLEALEAMLSASKRSDVELKRINTDLDEASWSRVKIGTLNRQDNIDKKLFQEWVKTESVVIKNVSELRNHPKYPLADGRYLDQVLRRWYREAMPEVKLANGRPKKDK